MDSSDCLVICGFGSLGSSTARALQLSKARNVSVVEAEHGRFEKVRKFGFRAILGDATDAHRLRVARVGAAARVMICVGDEAAATVVRAARRLAPVAYIVVALRTAAQQEAAISAGASEVIVLSRLESSMLADSIGG